MPENTFLDLEQNDSVNTNESSNFLDLTGNDLSVNNEDVVVNDLPKQEEVVEVPQVDEINYFAKLKEKYNVDIDEDYITTNWREKAISVEKEKEELNSFISQHKDILDNQDVRTIAEYMKNGVPAENILKAMSIDVDTIPQEDLIYEFIKREHPYLTDDSDVSEYAKKVFGVGADLEELKSYDIEGYAKILNNLNNATTKQKEYISNQKITLLNTPVYQEKEFVPKDVIDGFVNDFSKYIETLNEVQLADGIVKQYNKEELKDISNNILYSGVVEGKNYTILENVDAKAILDAMYLMKNKETFFNEVKQGVTKDASIKAYKDVNAMYNGVKISTAIADDNNTEMFFDLGGKKYY